VLLCYCIISNLKPTSTPSKMKFLLILAAFEVVSVSAMDVNKVAYKDGSRVHQDHQQDHNTCDHVCRRVYHSASVYENLAMIQEINDEAAKKMEKIAEKSGTHKDMTAEALKIALEAKKDADQQMEEAGKSFTVFNSNLFWLKDRKDKAVADATAQAQGVQDSTGNIQLKADTAQKNFAKEKRRVAKKAKADEAYFKETNKHVTKCIVFCNKIVAVDKEGVDPVVLGEVLQAYGDRSRQLKTSVPN